MTYELAASTAGGTSSTGGSNLNPGKNLLLTNNSFGVYIDAHITKPEDVNITSFSADRSVRISSRQKFYEMGRSSFARVDIGTTDGVSAIPKAEHDVGGNDRLRVSAGQYTYRNSTGSPFYFFTSPSVPSGAETGWVFRNAGSTQRFLIRGDANVGVGPTAANTNTPGGATSNQLAVYDANNALLGYIPIYAAPW